ALENNANIYQRKNGSQNERRFSNVDKQSSNELRNMNHLSDVLMEPHWRTKEEQQLWENEGIEIIRKCLIGREI
ncbi:hypothetical protein HispidOSU_000493, partial [Sigmodon hispidus]